MSRRKKKRKRRKKRKKRGEVEASKRRTGQMLKGFRSQTFQDKRRRRRRKKKKKDLDEGWE